MRVIPIPRLLGLGQISTLTQAIITQEGTCPSPTSCQNNNPGNLVYAGQPGASGVPGQIATFDTYDDGYNALVNQLGLYASGSCASCNGQPQTIAGTFQIYAPGSVPANNPTIYANNVAAALGVSTDTPLSSVLTGDTSALPSVDLSSLVSDFSTIDPTTFAVGALVVGFVALMLVRR